MERLDVRVDVLRHQQRGVQQHPARHSLSVWQRHKGGAQGPGKRRDAGSSLLRSLFSQWRTTSSPWPCGKARASSLGRTKHQSACGFAHGMHRALLRISGETRIVPPQPPVCRAGEEGIKTPLWRRDEATQARATLDHNGKPNPTTRPIHPSVVPPLT